MDEYLEDLLEIEEIAEWEEMINRQRRQRKKRIDPLLYYSEKEFQQRYRLSKELFTELLERIEPQLPNSLDQRGQRISPCNQFLVTLRYMATGNFQLTLGDCSDMAQSSVSRCLKDVCAAVATLAQEFIKFPTPQDENKMMMEFSQIAGMPGVIGCVDGTHIPIKSPGGPNAELYRCRKIFFSINVMVVCDASLRFTNVIVNWPGSAHDSRIFSSSRLAQSLESGMYRGFLLGDSGYPCRPYIMTPFLAPNTHKQRHYNVAHIRTRNLIERAIGLLKKRFAVLSIPVRTKLNNTKNIIIACAVLHNCAITNRIPLQDEENLELDPGEPDVGIIERADNIQGAQRRAHIVDSFFFSLSRLCIYFLLIRFKVVQGTPGSGNLHFNNKSIILLLALLKNHFKF
ncbi:putative nuclease HARBI1 [Macrobrachium nipponense]|uniref:putative nuclease HARBI1 n=1 Tax=Macrobrachium nipponense TaxID=159736 RepID=UPI0030C7D60B